MLHFSFGDGGGGVGVVVDARQGREAERGVVVAEDAFGPVADRAVFLRVGEDVLNRCRGGGVVGVDLGVVEQRGEREPCHCRAGLGDPRPVLVLGFEEVGDALVDRVAGDLPVGVIDRRSGPGDEQGGEEGKGEQGGGEAHDKLRGFRGAGGITVHRYSRAGCKGCRGGIG